MSTTTAPADDPGSRADYHYRNEAGYQRMLAYARGLTRREFWVTKDGSVGTPVDDRKQIDRAAFETKLDEMLAELKRDLLAQLPPSDSSPSA